jgi:hypothetical protein
MGKQSRAALASLIEPTVTYTDDGVVVAPNMPAVERRFAGYRIGPNGEISELSRTHDRGGSALVERHSFSLQGDRHGGGKLRRAAKDACLVVLADELQGRAKSFAELCDNSSLAYNLAVSERGSQLIEVAPIVAVAIHRAMIGRAFNPADRDRLLAVPLPELAAATLARTKPAARVDAVLNDKPRTFMKLNTAALAYCRSGEAFFALAHRGNDFVAALDVAKRSISVLLHQRAVPEPLRVSVDRVRQADTIADWQALHEFADTPPLFYAYLRNPAVARRELDRYFVPAVRDGYGNDITALARAVKIQLVDTFRQAEGRNGVRATVLSNPTRRNFLEYVELGWSFGRWCRESKTFHREVEARMAQERAAERAQWAGVEFTRVEEFDGYDLGNGMTARQLTSAEQLDYETAIFQNCVYTYKSRCAKGESIVFVVERAKDEYSIPVAMFELSRDYRIRQIEAPRHSRATLEVRDAIQNMVASARPAKPYVGVFQTKGYGDSQ